jgi:hypothetical protein
MAEEQGGAEKVVYSETMYISALVWVLVLPLVGLYVAIAIGAVVKHKGSGYIYFFGIVGVLLLVVLAAFWKLVFIITETEVVFGFSLFRKRFEREKITSCDPYELKFSNYYGYGIRIGRDGTVAYNTRNGAGVKLTVEGAERQYVVSVKNSGYICKILGSNTGVRS